MVFINASQFNRPNDPIRIGEPRLREEINKLFSENNKISIYPRTRLIEIKQGHTDGFGISIKNVLVNSTKDKEFSYIVSIYDSELKEKCGIDGKTAENWIVEKSERNIPIPFEDIFMQKIIFEIPLNAPLCTIRYRVNITTSNIDYATDFIDVKIISQ
jgi:hypothetical protein